jgi:hypothetical protein
LFPSLRLKEKVTEGDEGFENLLRSSFPSLSSVEILFLVRQGKSNRRKQDSEGISGEPERLQDLCFVRCLL